MSQRKQNRYHYSDGKSIDISLVPLIIVIVNRVSDIAAKLYMTSGAIMNTTAEKVQHAVNGIEDNIKLPHRKEC